MISLINKDKKKMPAVVFVILLVAALLLVDGMITPAFSVISAIAGLNTISPNLNHLIIHITVVILIFLFALKKRDTEAVGKLFGSVTQELYKHYLYLTV